MKWIIDPSEEAPLGVIEDTENGDGICTLEPHKLPHEQDSETLATARLIAAAPDMLELLKDLCLNECQGSGLGVSFKRCGVLNCATHELLDGLVV